MAKMTSDGKMMSNGPAMRRHEKRLSYDKQQSPPVNDPSLAADDMDVTSDDPSQLAAEHGPAETVTIQHGDGGHTVDSTHPDGHTHHSDHASAGEAAEHAKMLLGE